MNEVIEGVKYYIVGEGPVCILIIVGDNEIVGLTERLKILISSLENLRIYITSENNVDNLKRSITKLIRPFAVIINLTFTDGKIEASGPRYKEILKKSVGEDKINQFLRYGDSLANWYLENFDLPSIKIGLKRPDLHSEVKSILQFFNGK